MAHTPNQNRPLAGHVIDGLDQPCGVVTPGGELLQWNEKICEVTGYSSEELAEMHAADLVPEEERRLIEEKIRAVLKGGPVTVQAHYLTKDGRKVPYEFRAALQQAGGHTVIVGTGRKIDRVEAPAQVPGQFKELLQKALDPLPVYLFIQDFDFRYRWFSSMRPGLAAEDFVGRRDLDMYGEEDAEQLHEVKNYVLQTGEPARTELSVTLEGERLYFDTYLAPLRSEEGEMTGLVGASVDITERKREEEQRLASEQRYRELFEAARDGIAIHTPEGKILDINPAGLEMLGYSQEELETLSTADLHPHPEQAERGRKIMEEEGEIRNLEVTLRRKDGEEIVCLLSSTAQTSEQGEPERYFTLFRDITERKQYQEQFRLLVEEIEDYAIFLLDVDGRVMSWNEGAGKIKGYAREEILGEHLSVFYTEQAREAGKADQALEQAAGQGRVENTGWRVRKDGTRFWARATLTALFDAQGRLRGFAKVTRDLTDQREREQALRESEERYRRLFEESQEGIGISTPEGKMIDVNAAALEILGYTREEIEEMRLQELYVDPKERESAREIMAEEGAVRNLEVSLRRGDGQEIVCQLSSTAIRGPEGEIEAFQTFFRDITAQKRAQEALQESEEKHRRLFEESRDAVILTTPEGNILDVNTSAEELFGYSEEEFLTMVAGQLYAHPGERGERILPELLESESASLLEAEMRHKDGSTFLASASVTVHRDEEGNPELIQALVRDITRQRRLEEQLLEIQEAERRRIGQELHDGIASQLTGITMIGEGLAGDLAQGKEVRPEELEEMTELIRESAQQTRLLSRGLNPVQVGEEGLPAALEQLAERTEKQSGLSCTFTGEKNGLALDEQRSAHLYRIAQEAVNNAVKHAEAEVIEVRLSTTNGGLELSVIDDGRGIPAKARRQEGEGLGLHTMRYRADLIGGRLEITRRPDGGTQVSCALSV